MAMQVRWFFIIFFLSQVNSVSAATLCETDGCIVVNGQHIESRSVLQKNSQLKRASSRSTEDTRMHGLIREPQRRHVYLDFGANWANTLRLYQDIVDKAEVQSGPWEVYAFEASPLIVPYLNEFVGYLNGEIAKPSLKIPPSGSSSHLQKYAQRYGCGGLEYGAMRSCMFSVFEKPLADMRADMSLMTDDLIRSRLDIAKTVPSGKDRYVLIPAAAGAKNGKLHLGHVDAEQMIRGGAIDNDHGGKQYDVPLVNVVSWLSEHFQKDDYIVIKMDIEGGEFPILNELMSQGKAGLIDKIALECHANAGNCDDLISRFRAATEVDPLFEGKDYEGWDSHSSPDLYIPTPPS